MVLVDRRGEQGVGAGFRASDTAAQLIELREAEHVGAIDDQGIGGGNIEAGFDNIGRDQHIIFAVIEGADALFQFGGGHLSMRDGEFGFRHILPQPGGGVVEVFETRADEKALAAAKTLAEKGLADDEIVEGRDKSAHGEAIDRRRGDDRQFAHPRQRQLQGARDRRGGQGQHMDGGAQFLELFLVADAEMLLLVDDDQPEILEGHLLAEHGMGADDDIHRTIRRARARCAHVGGGGHARHLRQPDRQAGKTRGEILVMLAGEQRGRHHHRDLRPSTAAAKAARKATSVLPKPTSPQISRSIGLPEAMSPKVASMAESWSSVSS